MVFEVGLKVFHNLFNDLARKAHRINLGPTRTEKRKFFELLDNLFIEQALTDSLHVFSYPIEPLHQRCFTHRTIRISIAIREAIKQKVHCLLLTIKPRHTDRFELSGTEIIEIIVKQEVTNSVAILNRFLLRVG